MERKLKFRVWTGNEMEHSVVVGEYGVFYVNPENGTGLDPRDTASLTPNNTKYHDDTPVMQYSGINDKNGKEIYEGDIVKITDPYDEQEHITSVYYANSAFIIEWDNMFGEGDADITTVGWAIDMDFEFEVIGNIYENPELINKI